MGALRNKSLNVGRLIFLVVLVLAGVAQGQWVEEQKLLSWDGEAHDWFGYSVSISGEYCLVSAPEDDDNGYRSGSAYIFMREGESWTEQAKLLAWDGAAQDWFGSSISINGDYCIIGASYDDDKGGNSGSAYIFKREGETWIPQTKLCASDGEAGDQFGCSVLISGDYCIVGAYSDDDNGYRSGSAYLFVREGESWTEQAKLLASDGQEWDFFGASVSMDEDHCIIGAWGDDDNGNNSGSAYIFEREDNSWAEQAKLPALDSEKYRLFGYSVSISGNYCVVGAGYDNDEWRWGAVSAYIFKRSGNEWIEQSGIVISDVELEDGYASFISISGDYCVVGAAYDGDNGSHSGSVYIFKREGDNWVEWAKLVASDGTYGDIFGSSVSISGDYCIIGARNDDDNGDSSGSAYVFRRENEGAQEGYLWRHRHRENWDENK